MKSASGRGRSSISAPQGPALRGGRLLVLLIQIKAPRECRRQNGVLLQIGRCTKSASGKRIPMPLAKIFAETAVLMGLTWALRRMAASWPASQHRIEG
jgi:hypothetical protein